MKNPLQVTKHIETTPDSGHLSASDSIKLGVLRASGEEGANVKLRGEMQPQPQGPKDPEELQGCALNERVHQSPSLTASKPGTL